MIGEKPTIVYRACLKKRSGDLSGTGASLFGGRWNCKSQPVVYTSDSRALALLEMRVNNPAIPVEAGVIMVLELNPAATLQSISQLPENWRTSIEACQKVATEWFDAAQADILQVPSAVLTTQFNYIVRASSNVLTQICRGAARLRPSSLAQPFETGAPAGTEETANAPPLSDATCQVISTDATMRTTSPADPT